MKTNNKEFNHKLLMLTTLIISGCSIVYELLISATSSYLVGDSIKQFSLTIGLYMSAMGIGSYLSKYIKEKLFDFLVTVELLVGIVGGCSALILFSTSLFLNTYNIVMYYQIIFIGILVGLEIPLLTRIMEKHKSDLSITLSSIFTFDYMGGLIGSVLFPLLLLPQLGYFTTSFIVGSLNIIAAIIIIHNYKDYLNYYKHFKILAIVSLILMIMGSIFSENLSRTIEDKMYRDKVIFSKQTQYQRIVMTKFKNDLRLFLDGNIQFSSIDEYRYHEALVHLPMSVANKNENVLILGGGDGLAAREVFKYDHVKKITLVDLDKEMTDLCKSDKAISKLNDDSLNNKNLQIINEDAFSFLEENNQIYDVIIVDLPDPNNDALNKLYTNLFYRLCDRSLSKEGAMVVQSTSPYSAKEAFWCINKTLKLEGFNVIPYHVQVPSFGEWGFNLATKDNLNISNLKLNVQTKFLTNEIIPSLFAFAKDELVSLDKIKANTLSHPTLINYYQKAVEEWI